MYRFKYSFLLLLFAGITVASCTLSKVGKFDKVFSFDRNTIEKSESEFVCQLSEDSIFLGQIKDFTLLNDTSFVVVDGRGSYLYHISGTLQKQFGNSGRAEGEMLSPSLVYATPKFVYIWCSTLMKLLVFDHESHFITELSDLKIGVTKFIVDANDENVCFYTNGITVQLENKVIDVVAIYNISQKTLMKYGERKNEDEVLSVWSNSGGLYTDNNRLIYLHPGNLIIYDFDLNSGMTFMYKIKDKAFQREEVINAYDLIQNRPKLHDYILKSSFVKGLYCVNGQFIIVSEIGQFDPQNSNTQDGLKNRKIKLYIFDSSFAPNRTILYDYISSPNTVIYSNAMYFLTLNVDGDDQIITLNRFPLAKE